MSLSRLMFYSEEMTAALGDHVPYEDVQLDLTRMARWHPLNRALAVGARVMLGGMLLSSKGDRVAMHSSVETRYPFLDEAVVGYLARLHPRWKLHGLTDKYVLRLLAERWLPKSIAWRKKAMFRRRWTLSIWKMPRILSISCSATRPFARQDISIRRPSMNGAAN